MKTYYVVADGDLPSQRPGTFGGEWHAIDLASHGNAGAGFHVLVTPDRLFDPRSSWQAMPHLLDARTTIKGHGKGHEKLLADVGVQPNHTAFDAARALAGIVRLFEP